MAWGAALAVVVIGVAAQPTVAQVMTLSDYVSAVDKGGEDATGARRYLDGILHGILVVDDQMATDGGSSFLCQPGGQAGPPDLTELRREIGAWLQVTAQAGGDADLRAADIPTLVLGYLSNKFACSGDDAAGLPGQPGLGGGTPDMKSLLLR